MSKNIDPANQVHTRTNIVLSAGTLLESYDDRRGVIIQNLSTDPLFVKLGSGATTLDFDFVLKGGASSDDGLGGMMSFDVLSYTGIITIDGSNIRCTATEI